MVIYAQDLSSYDLSVIAQALDGIGLTKRAQGEPGLPEIGAILERIRAVIRSGRPSFEQESASRWLDYIARCKAEGAEVPDEEMKLRMASINSKFNLEKTKEIVTVHTEMVCPQCRFAYPVPGNIRFWTSEELRQHADTLDELAAIAERNRSMPDLPLGDGVEGAA